ncbi:hypothetical protein MTO96_017933 [Rhipicephalus appendiculatus]
MTVDNAPGYKGISSGNHHARMLMSQAIPNLFKVDGKTISCEYEGVVRLCRRSLFPGHHAAQCETPVCERCDEYEHLCCKAACKRCGGDHKVLLCKQKTYSLATSQSSAPQATTSATVGARIEEFPTIEDSVKEGQQKTEKQSAPVEVHENGAGVPEPAKVPPPPLLRSQRKALTSPCRHQEKPRCKRGRGESRS